MHKQLIYELSRGLAYRRITHPEMALYTTWIPAAITVLVLAIYLLAPDKPALIGRDSLAQALVTLVSTLPGFYFAGLAAVATFGSETMDREMPPPAPTINILVSGQFLQVRLTRRLFLSYLFSYLVVLSLALCFSLITLNALSSSIERLYTFVLLVTNAGWPWLFMQMPVLALVTFAFASMITTTLHGVFFLTEKIHQP